MRLFLFSYFDDEGDPCTITQCFDSYDEALHWATDYLAGFYDMVEIGSC